MAFLRFAAMPLTLILRGHFFFLTFAGLFAAGIFSGLDYLTYLILIVSRSLPPEPRAIHDWAVKIVPWMIDFCWLLAAPFGVVLVSKPVRTLWLIQNLASWDLYKGSFRDILHVLRSLPLVFRQLLPYLVPVAAMGLLFLTTKSKLTDATYPAFLALWAAVSLVCLYKASVSLSAPFITVLGACMPEEALYLSPSISGRKRAKISTLMLLIFSAIPVFNACGFEPGYVAVGILFAVLWYLGTLLACVVMGGLMDYLAAETAAQQPPVSPSPPQPPPPASVTVQVTKAWVKE